MTIDVTPSDLRRAAKAIESAGEQVAHADPSGRVKEIAHALPDSASAEQAGELTEKLEKRFKYWRRDADKLRDGYVDAAREYEEADSASSAQAARMRRELDELRRGY